ncbi:hypothetical protein [Acinetobacter sp.]|jgi:hypothetical protein|uniref:A1S_1983 family putative colistin resistance protein n=1 Tax=Acinetobacter sp. TaxID=472 RepID=UPI0035B4C603
MLLKSDINIIKTIAIGLSLSFCFSSTSFAEAIDCSAPGHSLQKVCSSAFDKQRDHLDNLYLTSLLVTDAPARIIKDTQLMWVQRLQQCRSMDCYKQQIDLRADDLNIFVSLNQSLTQHYLKFEDGGFAQQQVHIKVHQLSKDRIKIEGIAYRSPNNRMDRQSIAFLAYTTPDQKTEIMDNEHDCKYQFSYSKALLAVKTAQKGCERFAGIYRLYD